VNAWDEWEDCPCRAVGAAHVGTLALQVLDALEAGRRDQLLEAELRRESVYWTDRRVHGPGALALPPTPFHQEFEASIAPWPTLWPGEVGGNADRDSVD
jgi:hypothetical protein